MPWAGDERGARGDRAARSATPATSRRRRGGLENARKLEDALAFVFAVRQAAGEPVFYRFWTA